LDQTGRQKLRLSSDLPVVHGECLHDRGIRTKNRHRGEISCDKGNGRQMTAPLKQHSLAEYKSLISQGQACIRN
ncbi:MAG: hypothetical protein EBZ09_05880, partial [Betaproteobacteria bacterium]|nr:hypothetical protein [Betaproteobacteria bacterium]